MDVWESYREAWSGHLLPQKVWDGSHKTCDTAAAAVVVVVVVIIVVIVVVIVV